MMAAGRLPRILVIDDEFGRSVDGGVNRDRERICSMLRLVDVSEDASERPSPSDPIAEAVFHRGQRPFLARVGDRVENDLDGIISAVKKGWDQRLAGEPPWAMILLDLGFCTGRVTRASNGVQPGMAEGRDVDDRPSEYFGLRVLEALRAQLSGVPVAILSSQQRGPVDAMIDRLGHCGFVSKTDPRSAEYLGSLLWRHGLFSDPDDQIVGTSLAILTSLRDARRLADASRNVLLQGERGTGKELFARFVHRHGKRREAPLTTVDCGAIVEELFESELFGHQKGAFTGAVGQKVGRIVAADGGHLFLDEVGNMPERIQRGLLRVIDDGLVTPVGARETSDTVQVDVRFLSASNEDLDGRALAGTFKPDLLDRLRRGGTIFLPPLRARKEDVPALAVSFLERAVAATPECSVRAIAPEAIERLREHDWPGNVRELEDCINQAVFNHRDVRTLFPAQIQIAGPPLRHTAHPTSSRNHAAATTSPGARAGSVDQLLAAWETRPGDLRLEQIHGLLPEVRRRYARVVAQLLAESLRLTMNLDGSYNFTAAVDRFRGSKRDTTVAASEIKRLLKIDPPAIRDLLQDPPLREAFEWAEATRPSRPRKRQGAKK